MGRVRERWEIQMSERVQIQRVLEGMKGGGRVESNNGIGRR